MYFKFNFIIEQSYSSKRADIYRARKHIQTIYKTQKRYTHVVVAPSKWHTRRTDLDRQTRQCQKNTNEDQNDDTMSTTRRWNDGYTGHQFAADCQKKRHRSHQKHTGTMTTICERRDKNSR